jgi:hypothetical protein
VTSLENAIKLGTGLINNVFLIPGTIAKSPNAGTGDEKFEYTPFATLKVPHESNGVFMVRSAVNMQWHQILLKDLDFSQAVEWEISKTDLGINEITQNLAPPTLLL